MSSIVKKLTKHNLMTPSHDFVTDTIYEVIMGSMAYGVNKDNSDMDVYAVCVPNKTMIFPHLTGHITGFGPAPENFEVYQKHHMKFNEKEYDVNVYGLIRYFKLCADNNPNMIDSLFVPDRCILFQSDAGAHMRSHRRLFLSKKIFDKMRGYAFSEFKKLEKGYNPQTNAKRYDSVQNHGYCVKSAYHVVRLMLEAEMALNEGDLDLERHREQLKFVRDGGYTLEELGKWFHSKEIELTKNHTDSKLPLLTDLNRIRILLYECLDMHFGSLNMVQNTSVEAVEILEKIKRLVNK